MASSENQGLQIALIIFVMLTIILSVTTFVFFRQYEEADGRSRADAEKSANADKALRTIQDENNELKQVIGVAATAKLDEVKATFNEDMQKFGAIPAEKRYYRPALEYIFVTFGKVSEELVNARDEIQHLKNSNTAFENASKTQIAEAEQSRNTANEKLASATDQFNEEREKKNQENKELADKLAATDVELKETADKAAKDVENLVKQQKLDRGLLAAANKKVNDLEAETFEIPDGEIRAVDQKTASVWINLGRADGLHRQISFGVFGAGENVGVGMRFEEEPAAEEGASPGGPEPEPVNRKASLKGKIEVTKVLDEHFAEARILEDSLSDPIVPGDLIFTPLWHPGRAEHVAIAGLIDLDNDDRDDRPLVRNLITMGGGIIDAEVDATGKRTGTMTINTRYLIMGDPPEEEAALLTYSEIQTEAQRLGVEDINVAQFLDHVGWKDPKRVLVFGLGGNAEDIPPDAPDGGRAVAPGRVSDLFQKRRPPKSRSGSAY